MLCMLCELRVPQLESIIIGFSTIHDGTRRTLNDTNNTVCLFFQSVAWMCLHSIVFNFVLIYTSKSNWLSQLSVREQHTILLFDDIEKRAHIYRSHNSWIKSYENFQTPIVVVK